MINLNAFCSKERSRSYISQPYSIGEFTYATNGHIAIRVPGVVALPNEKAPASIEGMFADADTRAFRPFDLVTAPPAKRVRCERCRGAGYVTSCETCDGEGLHTCNDDSCGCEHECGACKGMGAHAAIKDEDGAEICDECDGAGRERDRRYVDIGEKTAVMWAYLDLVQSLPGPVEIARDRSGVDAPYAAIAFRGDGWTALIVPARWSGREEIRACDEVAA